MSRLLFCLIVGNRLTLSSVLKPRKINKLDYATYQRQWSIFMVNPLAIQTLSKCHIWKVVDRNPRENSELEVGARLLVEITKRANRANSVPIKHKDV